MRTYLYLALLAPLFFLAPQAAATAIAHVQPVAHAAQDDAPPLEHPDCDAKRDRLDEIDDEVNDKLDEQDRYQLLLDRYIDAGAGDSVGANAMRSFIAQLDADIDALDAEAAAIWDWIIANCFI